MRAINKRWPRLSPCRQAIGDIVARVLIILMVLVASWTARADQNSEANQLAVEAREIYDRAAAETDPLRRVQALEKVLGNLRRIISDYPGSDLAVRILNGERVAGLLLEDAERLFREAHDEATALQAKIDALIEKCTSPLRYKCLIDGTVAIANVMGDLKNRTYVLKSAASSLVSAGEIANAIDVLKGIQDTAYRAACFAEIVKSQAEAGNSERARELMAVATTAINEAVAESIEYPLNVAITDLAVANVYIGDEARAIAIAMTPVDESDWWRWQRITILEDVATVFVETGNLTAASNILDRLSDLVSSLAGRERLDPLTRLAAIHAKARNLDLAKQKFETAVQIARDIPDPSSRDGSLRELTTEQAEAGLYKEALATVQFIGSSTRQEESRGAVVEAQARAGYLNEARANLALIDRSYSRAKALVEIARAYLAIGDTEKALEIAQGLLDELGYDLYNGELLIRADQVEIMAEIAAARAITGDARAAKALFSEAVELLSGLKRGGAGRDLSAAHVAVLQAKSGYVGEAIDTANLTDDSYRDVVLSDIVAAQLTTGELVGARVTALSIEEARHRAPALIEIAASYTDATNREGAVENLMGALMSVKDIAGTAEQLEVLLLVATTLQKLG